MWTAFVGREETISPPLARRALPVPSTPKPPTWQLHVLFLFLSLFPFPLAMAAFLLLFLLVSSLFAEKHWLAECINDPPIYLLLALGFAKLVRE